MALREYTRKRQFDRTPEPRPEQSVEPDRREIFVVQLHHASRRHYDFRLQVGDVLKSWACPKGPSYDPKVKRLAVEVEDHPVSYASFEGDIPDGYGAGHVDLFDTGVWATDEDPQAQLRKGHLRFELYGKRLKGTWHLVRSHRKERQPAWFLIKGEDAFASDVEADDLLDATMIQSTKRASGRSGGARDVAAKLEGKQSKATPKPGRKRRMDPAKIAASLPGTLKKNRHPGFFKPELARLRETPPTGDDWLSEVKWDGYRILTSIAKGKVDLWSRNGLSWTAKLPEVVQAIEALGLDSAQLDGELIAVTDGQPDFNALQQTLSGEQAARLIYMLFDVPYLEGYDLTRCKLIDRKEALRQLLDVAPAQLGYSAHVVGHADQAFAQASERKLEGILCKRAHSPYRGGRGDDWIKVKRLEADEFAVVGFTAPKGSRKGLGSLLLARPAPKGEWAYVGRVGSGFTDDMLRDLARTFSASASRTPTIKHTGEAPRDAQWIAPALVAEVYYRGIGNQGLLRQPSLKAMRPDKSPASLRDRDRSTSITTRKRPASGAKTRTSKRDGDAMIVITHPDRAVYPKDGYTKQDVADYYRAVMDWFLPGILHRPLSVIRWPDGIAGQSFFQKHVPAGGLKYVGVARLTEETGASAMYLFPESADSVMELVQYNAIEFHPWGAHVEQPDCADRVVFDLDPGPDVAWNNVKAAARLMRKRLGQLKLESFLRTTGGKGLHIVVPLNPPSPWDEVKTFARGFAETMEAMHPLDFISTSSKARRTSKIYIDYLRNGRGATAVASYSLRGRPGAPVAMPVRWEELGRLRGANQFDLKNAVTRLKRQRKDPWEGIEEVKQSLTRVLKALAKK
ncbi:MULTISPECIES: DNA ligase D [Dyella]|uniref:DNA ligase (ATP) n=2 Tax=Dyella TaxID=231454 RepID=A0A4R0Z1V1_9GAMM|nr:MULTISPECIES: DNA ligase D [Dyella]TBR40670.1 DNA ligase D [Dyella terrae]TCI13156.1 DNA ligase D [Dyella soli]